MTDRDWAGPRILSQGFRPFFLAAGISAPVMVAIWILWFLGLVDLEVAYAPVAWHAHEMIFGMATAALAGFLLTAVPNWTGRLPVRGWPLAALIAIWLTGRLAMSTDVVLGGYGRALVDLAFLTALLAVALREITAGRNWRNLPVVSAIGVLLVANGITHAEALGYVDALGIGVRLGIGVLVFLIALIGGRIVPSFTGNWLANQRAEERPRPFGRFDRLALIVTAIAMPAWAVAPDAPMTGAALVAAGVLNGGRLSTWKGHRTFREPLVWSLHLGFAWLPVGLILAGAAALMPSMPSDAGIHALTAGAIGGMISAVMTRATLGHTGRELAADHITAAIYILIFIATLLRVVAPSAPDQYIALLALSAAAWCGAFLTFCIRFGGYLLGR